MFFPRCVRSQRESSFFENATCLLTDAQLINDKSKIEAQLITVFKLLNDFSINVSSLRISYKFKKNSYKKSISLTSFIQDIFLFNFIGIKDLKRSKTGKIPIW